MNEYFHRTWRNPETHQRNTHKIFSFKVRPKCNTNSRHFVIQTHYIDGRILNLHCPHSASLLLCILTPVPVSRDHIKEWTIFFMLIRVFKSLKFESIIWNILRPSCLITHCSCSVFVNYYIPGPFLPKFLFRFVILCFILLSTL